MLLENTSRLTSTNSHPHHHKTRNALICGCKASRFQGLMIVLSTVLVCPRLADPFRLRPCENDDSWSYNEWASCNEFNDPASCYYLPGAETACLLSCRFKLQCTEGWTATFFDDFKWGGDQDPSDAGRLTPQFLDGGDDSGIKGNCNSNGRETEFGTKCVQLENQGTATTSFALGYPIRDFVKLRIHFKFRTNRELGDADKLKLQFRSDKTKNWTTFKTWNGRRYRIGDDGVLVFDWVSVVEDIIIDPSNPFSLTMKINDGAKRIELRFKSDLDQHGPYTKFVQIDNFLLEGMTSSTRRKQLCHHPE
ncbi:hypothetical protein ACA910_014334 [Epithemia clementina (nom. ined.)]